MHTIAKYKYIGRGGWFGSSFMSVLLLFFRALSSCPHDVRYVFWSALISDDGMVVVMVKVVWWYFLRRRSKHVVDIEVHTTIYVHTTFSGNMLLLAERPLVIRKKVVEMLSICVRDPSA